MDGSMDGYFCSTFYVFLIACKDLKTGCRTKCTLYNTKTFTTPVRALIFQLLYVMSMVNVWKELFFQYINFRLLGSLHLKLKQVSHLLNIHYFVQTIGSLFFWRKDTCIEKQFDRGGAVILIYQKIWKNLTSQHIWSVSHRHGKFFFCASLNRNQAIWCETKTSCWYKSKTSRKSWQKDTRGHPPKLGIIN